MNDSSNRLPPIVLGSQSPRRRQLLETLVLPSRIQVYPPQNSEEAGFAGLCDWNEIEQRLQEIAETKIADVSTQCSSLENCTIITADTVVIVKMAGESHVLGKPDGKDWEQTVRDWFLNHYSGTTHQVATVVCFRFPDGSLTARNVVTEVRFKPVPPALLDWYIATGEPLGKAGGYGIQGAGSLFVAAVAGSLSNVIGLPLETVWEVLAVRNLL